jgi:hypothetical protein
VTKIDQNRGNRVVDHSLEDNNDYTHLEIVVLPLLVMTEIIVKETIDHIKEAKSKTKTPTNKVKMLQGVIQGPGQGQGPDQGRGQDLNPGVATIQSPGHKVNEAEDVVVKGAIMSLVVVEGQYGIEAPCMIGVVKSVNSKTHTNHRSQKESGV